MIVVSLTLRVPPADIAKLRPAIEALVLSSRREEGVIEYNFAIDMIDPAAIRILEIYADQNAFEAHLNSPHFQAWRPLTAQYAREGRRIINWSMTTEAG